jgi:hypothetical protein
MATTAEIKNVRREARLHGYEYFTGQTSTSLVLTKQQPPITIYEVQKNTTIIALTTGYTFDNYKTITLTTTAGATDTYRIEYGYLCEETIVGDVIDRSKEEVYADLRLYWTATILAQSTYVAELSEQLAAGYLIMKYWEGHPRGEDFWKYGRQLVDESHKRISQLKDGEKELLTGAFNSTIRAAKEYTQFQYKILTEMPGLKPSGLYTQKAEDNDLEEY